MLAEKEGLVGVGGVGMGREHSKWGCSLSEGSSLNKGTEVGQGAGSEWMVETLPEYWYAERALT